MKVIIKFSDQIETVENVSVDDKCFPVVAGLHPYPSIAGDVSPLVRESALWFKTLAVEAVYIDCDRKWIYWAPITNNAVTTDILLRRSSAKARAPNDFIPDTAKSLFKDNSIYDFDASLKEMMTKCSEAIRKLFKKSQSTDEFHKVVAKILHLYILPSITFTSEDMSCLTRAQCLIEARLAKSENEIANKANSIMHLRQCMDTLKNNLLISENLDSEPYLRSCSKDFLVAFLKRIELDVDGLNNELSAQQSKVNWAKQHTDEAYRLRELQERRDCLFQEIDKFIRVREAIKNVISRRDLTKRKVKKCKVENSCFHNVFVEICRRLELEERTLANLGNDKVNICAAREVVVCTILEMVENNRNSDRTTKFEPEDFADYSVNESQNVEKSSVWLTFQGRVARVLEDTSSLASRLHHDGCRRLTLKMNATLSEFHLMKKEAYTLPLHHESVMTGGLNSLLNTPVVTLRNFKSDVQHPKQRNAVLIDRKYESRSTHDPHSEMDTRHVENLQSTKAKHECDANTDLRKRRVLSTNDINISLPENQLWAVDDYFDDDFNKKRPQRSSSNSSMKDILTDECLSPVNNETDEDFDAFVGNKHPLAEQRHIMTEQLALGSLMNAVDSLKLQIGSHFMEVISCLGKEISRDGRDETSEVEQQELLWKSYDRFFCQEVYDQLMKLYVLGLSPSICKAYTTLRKTSLHEILKEDKLLDLFFGDTEMIERASLMPLQNQPEDKLSIARTLSDLSLDVRCCNIKELYTLANTDSTDILKRFNLEEVKSDDENDQTSSSGSQKSSDLSNDEENLDVMNSASASTSTKSTSSGSFTKEVSDEVDKRKTLSSVDKVEEILDPVLSPFKKLVQKCLDATCFLDKVRYITKATEGLNNDISQMIGADFQSACDDIISMLILALYNLSEEMFIGLYINLRLIMDVLPGFLSGTLWDYNLVTLCASYDYLFTLRVCELVVRQYPGSFRVRR